MQCSVAAHATERYSCRCFFQFGLFANSGNPLALLNYALVMQCINQHYATVRTFHLLPPAELFTT